MCFSNSASNTYLHLSATICCASWQNLSKYFNVFNLLTDLLCLDRDLFGSGHGPEWPSWWSLIYNNTAFATFRPGLYLLLTMQTHMQHGTLAYPALIWCVDCAHHQKCLRYTCKMKSHVYPTLTVSNSTTAKKSWFGCSVPRCGKSSRQTQTMQHSVWCCRYLHIRIGGQQVFPHLYGNITKVLFDSLMGAVHFIGWRTHEIVMCCDIF